MVALGRVSRSSCWSPQNRHFSIEEPSFFVEESSSFIHQNALAGRSFRHYAPFCVGQVAPQRRDGLVKLSQSSTFGQTVTEFNVWSNCHKVQRLNSNGIIVIYIDKSFRFDVQLTVVKFCRPYLKIHHFKCRIHHFKCRIHHFNTEFISLNTKFVILITEFIILNT